MDNFQLNPAMWLGTWVAFAPASEGVMVTGDVVVTETDLRPVRQEVIRQGLPVTTFLGFNTWAAFQGKLQRAANAGDIAMLENEVEPVLKALVENGIEVAALHNHMVHEQPRIFFLHYWGVGNASNWPKA